MDLPPEADAAMLRVKADYPEMADYAGPRPCRLSLCQVAVFPGCRSLSGFDGALPQKLSGCARRLPKRPGASRMFRLRTGRRSPGEFSPRLSPFGIRSRCLARTRPGACCRGEAGRGGPGLPRYLGFLSGNAGRTGSFESPGRTRGIGSCRGRLDGQRMVRTGKESFPHQPVRKSGGGLREIARKVP